MEITKKDLERLWLIELHAGSNGVGYDAQLCPNDFMKLLLAAKRLLALQEHMADLAEKDAEQNVTC